MALFSRFATQPVYNTNAVVQRTGVPADTFRAWERRYGLPHPARTVGNQRLYSERDIATIVWLRDQTRTGLTISQAIELLKAREHREIQSPEVAAPEADQQAASLVTGGLHRHKEQLMEALLAYDAQTASHVFEDALAFGEVEDLCIGLIQPCLYEVGALWQRGEILVSAEHFATAFFIRKLAALFNLSRPTNGHGPVVAACLEGELHEVGLLMTSLFLARRGIEVIYLGANLPLEDLIGMAEEVRPALVLLSASTDDGAADIARSSHELKARLAGSGEAVLVPEIGFGGRPFQETPELRESVSGVYCGEDAEVALATIDSLITRPIGSNGSNPENR